MDPNMMRTLGNQQLRQFEREADAARSMGLRGARGSREVRTGVTIDQSMSALLRCRWHQAEQKISRLPENGIAGIAALAMSAILSRLLSPQGRTCDSIASLSALETASGADSHAWAAATVALSLLEWCDGSSGLSTDDAGTEPDSIATVRNVCRVAQTLGTEARDLLCLSLALHARTIGDPVLGSFLLGKLSNVVDQLHGGLHGTTTDRGVSPAAPAAAGLCLITLGDAVNGRRLLLAVVDSADICRTPLVEGLIDAEMARVDHENGDDSGAEMWAERAVRFGRRYGCRLPLEIGAGSS